MKRRIALLLTVLVLALAAGAQAESHPLLYRVTDAEGHTVYLLGTIHVGREDFYASKNYDQIFVHTSLGRKPSFSRTDII